MHENRKQNDVAAVDEEPTSSATTSKQINQGGQEETRNTGKVHSPAQQEQKQHGSGHGCGCGGH